MRTLSISGLSAHSTLWAHQIWILLDRDSFEKKVKNFNLSVKFKLWLTWRRDRSKQDKGQQRCRLFQLCPMNTLIVSCRWSVGEAVQVARLKSKVACQFDSITPQHHWTSTSNVNVVNTIETFSPRDCRLNHHRHRTQIIATFGAPYRLETMCDLPVASGQFWACPATSYRCGNLVSMFLLVGCLDRSTCQSRQQQQLVTSPVANWNSCFCMLPFTAASHTSRINMEDAPIDWLIRSVPSKKGKTWNINLLQNDALDVVVVVAKPVDCTCWSENNTTRNLMESGHKGKGCFVVQVLWTLTGSSQDCLTGWMLIRLAEYFVYK